LPAETPPPHLGAVASVHDVAACLVAFLRGLPEPVLGFAAWPALAAGGTSGGISGGGTSGGPEAPAAVLAALVAGRVVAGASVAAARAVLLHLRALAARRPGRAAPLAALFAPLLCQDPAGGDGGNGGGAAVAEAVVARLMALGPQDWDRIAAGTAAGEGEDAQPPATRLRRR
jgi:hypothetical protein